MTIQVKSTLLNSGLREITLHTRQGTKGNLYLLAVFGILARSETPTFRPAKVPTAVKFH